MKRGKCLTIVFLILLGLLPACSLASVLTLPKALTLIHKDAFAGNIGLSDVIIQGNTEIENGAFSGCRGINAVHILSGEKAPMESLLDEIDNIQYVSAPGGSEAYITALQAETVLDVHRSDRRSRALIIYQSYKNVDSLKTLTGPANDATAVYRLLKQWGVNVRKNGGWTADEMVSQIQWMGETSEEGDITFIYFSGHGKTNGSLLGSDGEEMTLSEFTNAVATIKGRKVILVDACYSGRLIDDGTENDSAMISRSFIKNNALTNQSEANETLEEGESFPEKFTANLLSAFKAVSAKPGGPLRAPTQLAKDTGNYVMAAARYDQESWEAQLTIRYNGDTFSKQMGFFTYYLCRGLGWDGVADVQTAVQADADSNGYVPFNEAFEYVRNQLSSEDGALAKQGLIQSAQVTPENDYRFIPLWHLPYAIQ